jgi:hypothetical protein
MTEFEDTAAHELHIVSRYESKRESGEGTNKDLMKESTLLPRIRLYWQHGKEGRAWVEALMKKSFGQHAFNGEAAPYHIDVQVLSALSYHPLSRKPDGTTTSTRKYFTRPNTPRRRMEILSTLQKSLGMGSTGGGTIYGFERDDAPGFIKIGKGAYNSCTQRYGCIMTGCGYQPRVLFEAQMPHAANRIEDLIHLDLADHQRWDASCKEFAFRCRTDTSKSWEIKLECNTRHMEWFEIDLAKAVQVVERWQAFSWCKPYGGDGSLKEAWSEKIVEFSKDITMDSQALDNFPTKEWWKLVKEAGPTLETKPPTIKSTKVKTRTR